jgi:HD superfamily phosphohydrolase
VFTNLRVSVPTAKSQGCLVTLNRNDVLMKILNDPIYGFITVPHPRVLPLIDHPWFQRLRYIKQLGLSHLVYPGALHTRFHHALGAMHLMGKAIDVLRGKGHAITEEEALGAPSRSCCTTSATALQPRVGAQPGGRHHPRRHQRVGDGPLNDEFGWRAGPGHPHLPRQYPKRFLHQLVSSQLDVDRIDYLNRDSFYTGVSEGVIGGERIIKMLQVVDDRLVVEEKAIYSIEKFLVARR